MGKARANNYARCNQRTQSCRHCEWRQARETCEIRPGSNVVDSYQTCGAGSGKSNETFDNATRLKGQLKIFATADSSEDAWRLLNS